MPSARQEDYASLENVTNVVAQYVKKHAKTSWLSMKHVALRLLEQWPNLKNIFWTSYPNRVILNQKLPKHIIISESKVYVSFCAFYSTQFCVFSFTFANRRACDPSVVSSMCKLLNDIQLKFIKQKNLSSDLESSIYIDVSKKENLNPLNLIDIGTKTKLMSTDSTFFPDEKQTKFRIDCLKLSSMLQQYNIYKANFLLIFR